MKLVRLSYHDHEAGWGFDNLDFQPDVTLLVGASGVGKTRILNSIRKVRDIAHDQTISVWGVSWSADFLDDKGQQYTWEGEFAPYQIGLDALREWVNISQENREEFSKGLPERMKPVLVRESLRTDGQIIFLRDAESFQINGKQLEPKPSQRKSGFVLFDEEPTLRSAKRAIKNILVSDGLDERLDESGIGFRVSLRRLTTLQNIESVREAELPTFIKLVIASQTAKPTFDQIITAFTEIFPSIERVWVTDINSDEVYLHQALLFKEKGVNKPFFFSELSSGMKRTLFHLARLALWPDGTVILIDEFENSLGANCINVVADALMRVGDRLQFVISSHHPYIINKIPVDHWKIVARDKGQVQFFSAEQLKIGRSKHKAFTELINNKIFQNGHIPT